MPNTPKGLTYPSNSSPVAIPADIQELATDVDGLIVPNTGGTYTGSVSFTQPPSVPTPTSGLHAVNKTYADAINTDVTALETELGTNPSGTFSTVKDRLDSYTTGFATVGNLLTDNQASGTDTLADTTGFAAGSGSPVLASSTAQAASGSRSLSWTTAAIDDEKVAVTPSPYDPVNFTPVTPGTVVTAQLKVKSSAAEPFSLRIYWYSTSYVDATIGGNVTSSTSKWTTITVTGVAPAGCDRMLIILQRNSGAIGTVHYLDEMTLHKGTGGLWAMPGEPIVGQSRIAVNNAVDLSGTGSPVGVVSAAPGSSFLQIGDAVTVSGNLLWRKISGTGNVGWMPEGALADTGWRNVTAAMDSTFKTNRPNGALYLRRQGSLCEVRFIETGTPTATSGLIYDMPDGFWGNGSAKATTVMLNADTVVGTTASMLVTYTNGAWLYCAGWGTVPYMGSLTWTTTRDWPASLPGSAY